MARLQVLAMAVALAAVAAAAAQQGNKPNIVFIVSDDLGFNDVSFHGSKQVETPNIDAIAARGLSLMNYHAQPVCSPTRSTFMSGRHVIHTGIYMPFPQGTALRLNLSFTLLPEYLKLAGNYSTHMVGKWHCGQNVMKAIPIGRGFDTYFGYWSGAEDYLTHDTKGAYDYNDNTAPSKLRPAKEYDHVYSTFTFTEKAVGIISSFSPASPNPLFLYLPYQNVHWPLEAPQEYVDMYANNTGGNHPRNMVCAMIKVMDDGIGNVTKALKRAGIFDNTIMIFSSDNGGPTNGNEGTMSNNFPLRGGKNTIWEGGTRVVGTIAGPGIAFNGAHTFEKMHATDWLPTLVSMAAGKEWTGLVPKDEPAYQFGDGINQWPFFSGAVKESPRKWLLYEAHPPASEDIVHGEAAVFGDMKIIKVGQTHPADENGNFLPPGQASGSTQYVMDCGVATPHTGPANQTECMQDYCLFNVTADPCEYNNLAFEHPEIVAALVKKIAVFQATAVPPVTNEGCKPIQINITGLDMPVWQPCDAPAVLEQQQQQQQRQRQREP